MFLTLNAQDQAMLDLQNVSNVVSNTTAAAGYALGVSGDDVELQIARRLNSISKMFFMFYIHPKSSGMTRHFAGALADLDFWIDELRDYNPEHGALGNLEEAYKMAKESWDWAQMVEAV